MRACFFMEKGECVDVYENIKDEKLAIGIKQSLKAVATSDVKHLIVAKDAQSGILEEILSECSQKGIEVRYAETMAQLGKSSGIDVGSAVVAVLK